MPEVAGSLWSVAAENQLTAAVRMRAAGLRRLHWDVSDGQFARPGGFTPETALALMQHTGLAAEAHIMAVHPIQAVDPWTEFCDLVVVHIESHDWRRAVDRIASRGCVPGVALSPHTPPTGVPADLAVLCMAVQPGRAGSAFTDSVLGKLSTLRGRSPDRRLGIDGGVQRHHAHLAEQAGADWLVVGTDLFRHGGEQAWADQLDQQPDPLPSAGTSQPRRPLQVR